MVEGPGCKVKGEVMQKQIRGQTVVNTHSAQKDADTKREGNDFTVFVGMQVESIRTVGKELFMFFTHSDICIRVHFLMNGSVRYGPRGSAKQSEPVLSIFYSSEEMHIFESSISKRSTQESLAHCNNLEDLDICSPRFNFLRAHQMVAMRPAELICDVIMDQEVLPGVGNIIKNEGLFNSGINPNSKVEELSPFLIRCLVRRLRDFSSIFYKCRKTNKPLHPHLKVYNKNDCPECNAKLTVCKPGRLVRLTFFCSICQNNSSISTASVQRRNTLLHFVCQPDLLSEIERLNAHDRMWQCDVCTLINKADILVCDACLTARPSTSKKRKLSENSTCTPKKKSKHEFSELKQEVAEDAKMSFSSSKKLQPNAGAQSPLPRVPLCSGHKKKCLRKNVTRSNENKGRAFYCCSMGQSKQCNFFEWADLHHPQCEHGRVTIIRKVLKQNANNGREFYCCPNAKNQQCGFFQWTDNLP